MEQIVLEIELFISIQDFSAFTPLYLFNFIKFKYSKQHLKTFTWETDLKIIFMFYEFKFKRQYKKYTFNATVFTHNLLHTGTTIVLNECCLRLFLFSLFEYST